jgi:hypothetical protein
MLLFFFFFPLDSISFYCASHFPVLRLLYSGFITPVLLFVLAYLHDWRGYGNGGIPIKTR